MIYPSGHGGVSRTSRFIKSHVICLETAATPETPRYKPAVPKCVAPAFRARRIALCLYWLLVHCRNKSRHFSGNDCQSWHQPLPIDCSPIHSCPTGCILRLTKTNRDKIISKMRKSSLYSIPVPLKQNLYPTHFHQQYENNAEIVFTTYCKYYLLTYSIQQSHSWEANWFCS